MTRCIECGVDMAPEQAAWSVCSRHERDPGSWWAEQEIAPEARAVLYVARRRSLAALAALVALGVAIASFVALVARAIA